MKPNKTEKIDKDSEKQNKLDKELLENPDMKSLFVEKLKEEMIKFEKFLHSRDKPSQDQINKIRMNFL